MRYAKIERVGFCKSPHLHAFELGLGGGWLVVPALSLVQNQSKAGLLNIINRAIAELEDTKSRIRLDYLYTASELERKEAGERE